MGEFHKTTIGSTVVPPVAGDVWLCEPHEHQLVRYIYNKP